MTGGWRRRFAALIDELDQHPDIRVSQRSLGPPARPEDLARAEAALGRKLPDDLRAFFRSLDGARISWEHRDERWRAFGASGAVDIFDLAALRTRRDQAFVAVDFPYDDNFLGLDPHSDTYYWVTDSEDHVRKFSTGFDVYLEALLAARGFSYWQSMFLYSRDYQRSVEEAEGRLQAILPRLFPSFDITRVGRASQCAPAEISSLLAGPRLIVYRVADLPPAFTEELPDTSPLRSGLFLLEDANSTIITELFDTLPTAELPAADLQDGVRLAEMMGRLARRTFCATELLAPHNVPKGGRCTMTTSSALHTGDPDAVFGFLRGRGCLVAPIESLLNSLSFFKARSANGTPLQTLQLRSHVTNSRERYPLAHVGYGIFVIDRSSRANQRFSLYHNPEGLVFAGAGIGPSEHWLDVSLDDLAAGTVVQLELVGPPTRKIAPALDLSQEWIALGRPADLPMTLVDPLPEASPHRSRVFWLAPERSPLVKALQAAIEETPMPGITAAWRLCDQLEKAAADSRAAGPGRLQAGFHQANGDSVEAWLRATGCQIVALSELLRGS